MMPPQCGMLTIGARPMTLPDTITFLMLWSVLNCLKKAAPDSGGIVLSGDSGFGTPPSPFGPWQLTQPYSVYSACPSTARPCPFGTATGVAVDTFGSPAWMYATRSSTCRAEITWPQTGMYGWLGFADSPRPWLMMWLS